MLRKHPRILTGYLLLIRSKFSANIPREGFEINQWCLCKAISNYGSKNSAGFDPCDELQAWFTSKVAHIMPLTI
jgi:hypothetical protein